VIIIITTATIKGEKGRNACEQCHDRERKVHKIRREKKPIETPLLPR